MPRPANAAVVAVGNHLESIDVEAGIGLVEHAQPRLQQHHLQRLVALLLAAGKADIDLPAPQHVGVDAELAGDFADPLDEIRRLTAPPRRASCAGH